MTRHTKNRNPSRCPQCGGLVEVWPERSSVCYGCVITGERQRPQKYILDLDIGERIGCVTSRHNEPQEESK
jgi:hypothetical protein